MEIISKSEAKELGLKRYFTGKPCKHGHVSERRTSDSACIICKYKNNQTRSLREDVKNLVRDNNKSWYEKNKHWKRSVNDQWKKDNKEKHNEHSKAAYRRNPEARRLAVKKMDEKQSNVCIYKEDSGKTRGKVEQIQI